MNGRSGRQTDMQEDCRTARQPDSQTARQPDRQRSIHTDRKTKKVGRSVGTQEATE